MVSKISKPCRVAVQSVSSMFSFNLIFGLWGFPFTFLRAQHFFPSLFLVFCGQIFLGEGVDRSEYLFLVLTSLWPAILVEMSLLSHPADSRSSNLGGKHSSRPLYSRPWFSLQDFVTSQQLSESGKVTPIYRRRNLGAQEKILLPGKGSCWGSRRQFPQSLGFRGCSPPEGVKIVSSMVGGV